MKILVDTCVWSLALRRDVPKPEHLVAELKELIRELRAQLIGPVRQELLSGIKSKNQFKRLKDHLSVFPDLPLQSEDFELAAEFFNLAISKGIQGSNTDFLICSLAHRHDMHIFTTDNDFQRFATVIPIRLHAPRFKGEMKTGRSK